MNTTPNFQLYDATIGSDDDFVRGFIARTSELELLLDRLRSIGAGSETTHALVIGQRGMGKSSLLRRLSIAVDRDAVLNDNFIPLSFREEQYNVISLGTFWRNCCEALAEWCEKAGYQQLADQIDETLDDPIWPRGADSGKEFFAELCEQLKRRPILLIDNVDLILSGLPLNERWVLREVLQEDDGPIVIACSTDFLSEHSDRDAPFYEFFYIHRLIPLKQTEFVNCLRALATQRGRQGQPVQAMIVNQPGRMAALYTLTGGSPRVLRLLYGLLEQSGSQSVFHDLELLLDQVTPYYKARVEEFSTPTQRAIVDAIALNWDPITIRQLSAITGVKTTSLSGVVAKIRKTGFLQEVKLSEKSAGHQISERFLNIWYLMRHGTRRSRSRLRWLSLVLSRLYDQRELVELAAKAQTDKFSTEWHPDYRAAILAAASMSESIDESFRSRASSGTSWTTNVDQGLAESKFARFSPNMLENHSLAKDLSEINELADSGDVSKVISCTKQLLNDKVEELTKAEAETIKLILGELYSLLPDLQNALSCFSQIEVPSVRTQAISNSSIAVRSLCSTAYAYGRFEHFDIATRVYRKAINIFGNAKAPDVLEQVARAWSGLGDCLAKTGHIEEATKAYESVSSLFGESDETVLLARAAAANVAKGTLLAQSGRLGEANEAFDDVISNFGTAGTPDLLNAVALAVASKGFYCVQSEREQIEVFDGLVERFEDFDDERIVRLVAWSMVAKGTALTRLMQFDAARSVFAEVDSRFGTHKSQLVLPQVVRALIADATALSEAGKLSDALNVYDVVESRFSASANLQVQEEVADAMINKAKQLLRADKMDEAIAELDLMEKQYELSTAERIKKTVAYGLHIKGYELAKAGRVDEGLETLEKIIDRYGDAAEPELRARAVMVNLSKAYHLNRAGRFQDAIEAYEEIVEKNKDSRNSDIRSNVAMAMFDLSECLRSAGNQARADEIYAQAIKHFENDLLDQVKNKIASAICNQGWQHLRNGRYDQALEAFNYVIASFSNSQTPGIVEEIVRSHNGKSETLIKLSEFKNAIEVCEECIAEYSASPYEKVIGALANLMGNHAINYHQAGLVQQSVEVYDKMIVLLEEMNSSRNLEKLANAYLNRGYCFGESDLCEPAIKSFDQLLDHPGIRSRTNLAHHVVAAMSEKALYLQKLDETHQALALLDEVERIYLTRSESKIKRELVLALWRKGSILAKEDRLQEATRQFDEIAQEFGEEQNVDVQVAVADALLAKASILANAQNIEQAIAAYDTVRNLYGQSESIDLKLRSVKATRFKAWRLSKWERSEEALQELESLLNQHQGSQEIPLLDQLAQTHLSKSDILGSAGRFDEAMRASDDLIDMSSGSTHDSMRKYAAEAMLQKAIHLKTLGRISDETIELEKILNRFGNESTPELQSKSALALARIGESQLERGLVEEGIASLDQAIDLYDSSNSAMVQQILYGVAKRKSLWLVRLKRSTQAVDYLGSRASVLIDRSDFDRAGNILTNRGRILMDNLQDYGAAKECLRQAENLCFDKDWTRANLVWACVFDGDFEEARETREKIKHLATEGLSLLDAAVHLVEMNFGTAMAHFSEGLDKAFSEDSNYFEDIMWFCRVATKTHGLDLLAWFEKTANDDKLAPLFQSVVAIVNGPEKLLDVNVETRQAAEKIFNRIQFGAEYDYEHPAGSATASE